LAPCQPQRSLARVIGGWPFPTSMVYRNTCSSREGGISMLRQCHPQEVLDQTTERAPSTPARESGGRCEAARPTSVTPNRLLGPRSTAPSATRRNPSEVASAGRAPLHCTQRTRGDNRLPGGSSVSAVRSGETSTGRPLLDVRHVNSREGSAEAAPRSANRDTDDRSTVARVEIGVKVVQRVRGEVDTAIRGAAYDQPVPVA